MVRWLRWHCPPDTGFEIRALAVWGRARYLSVTEAPHNTNFHTWMGKKQFCFFETAETGNRTPDSGVKGSGVNHYPRAPAPGLVGAVEITNYLTLKLYGTMYMQYFFAQHQPFPKLVAEILHCCIFYHFLLVCQTAPHRLSHSLHL